MRAGLPHLHTANCSLSRRLDAAVGWACSQSAVSRELLARPHFVRVLVQNKFYQKFTRPEDAHAFFDVNGDGNIDEGEFCDVLRYAGCWNGIPLARATFKALIGQENDVLGVAEFVERLLVPNHETEKEITDRLRMTSTKAPTPAELTNQEHAIVTRFKAQLAQQKKHMNFSVRPLFRKMKSDGSGA